MKTISLLVILLLSAEMMCAQNADNVIIAKKIKISSVVLGEDRTIFVSTPSGYESSSDAYPVMYVLDGWPGIINFTSGLVNNLADNNLCPEMIIVAIENTIRMRDMSPTKPKFDNNGNKIKYYGDEKLGGADLFFNFFETELFPFIEKNYRTIPYRIFAGHSAGGMCVTYAFLSRPAMFNSYIAISPTLNWDSNLLNKTAEKNIGSLDLKSRQYYISVGGDETPSTIEDAHAFAQTIKLKSPAELRFKFDYIEHEDHGSQSTIAFYNSLRFIYEGWNFDFNKFVAGGLNAINSFYQNLTDRYGYPILPDGNTLNSIGWEVKRAGRQQEAIKILEENTIRHPEFPEAYSYLAEAYSGAGNYEPAIKNIKKAIELATAQKDQSVERYKIILDRTIKASKKKN